MGHSFLMTGDIAQGRAHLRSGDCALRSKPASLPVDAIWPRCPSVNFALSPFALWAHGYPEAALADADRVVKHAREINHAVSLMLSLNIASLTHIYCGNYAAANTQSDEVVALAEEKGIVAFEGCRNDESRLPICLDRQGLRRGPPDYLRIRCMAVNGRDFVFADLLVGFGESIRRPRPIRRRFALHWRSDGGNRNH